jgi:hypothetical protein
MWLATAYRSLTSAVNRTCAAMLTSEGRAFVALIALIVGCAVQTAMLGWLISILKDARATSAIADIAYGLLATEGMAFLSLTLLLGRRSISAEFWKAKFQASNEGGDDPPPPGSVSVTATATAPAAEATP